MIRYLLFLFLLCSSLNTPLVAGLNFQESIENPCGQPAISLLNVLQEFGITHDGSWQDIIAATQKAWLRKEGSERWDAPLTPFTEKQYDLFSQLNMTQSSHPEKCHYDYAVILGTTLDRVRSRLMFLKKEWNRGVRFDKLVILTGDRPLHPALENPKTLLHSPYPNRPNWIPPITFPHNETEMCKFVLEQMDLPTWDHVLIVDTPQKDGKRPNTQDTFICWLNLHPQPGSTLIIADQPFLTRADILARHMLPGFCIETVGEGCPWSLCQKEKRALPILLDELARIIFTRSF